VLVVTALLPAAPAAAVDIPVVQVGSLNSRCVEAASDRENVTVGVALVPGEVGDMDTNKIVGAVVSMTSALLAPKLPAAPGAGSVNVAELLAASRIDPPLRLRAVVLT
jgi:hypothetical protein